MSEFIEVLIGPAGEVKLEAHGFTGEVCKEKCAAIQNAIGQVVPGSEKKKPDFYESSKESDQIAEGGTT